jgi:hypothetical protein
MHESRPVMGKAPRCSWQNCGSMPPVVVGEFRRSTSTKCAALVSGGLNWTGCESAKSMRYAIAGHVNRAMLEHYSHVRQEAKRRAVESLDNVPITSQLAKWEKKANRKENRKTPANKQLKMVGAIGFEPTTPCAQGRCATRLRYAPT